MTETNGGGFDRKAAISSEKVKKLAADIQTRRQKLDDATTAHAEAWKRFDEAGGNKAALKSVLKLLNQDIAKTADYQFHFDFYADVLGLRGQIDLADQAEANEQSVREGETQSGPVAA